MDNIREATDTIYVFMCDTEKDFFLLSGGKKSTDFNNLYLDKDKVSARLKMVTTFPMVLLLKRREICRTSALSKTYGREQETNDHSDR